MNINQCSPVWSFRPKDNFPVAYTRKVMVSQLMIVFVIYIVVDMVIDCNLSFNHNLYKWRDMFNRCFADHIIGMGFALSFSPYVFEIILCIFHMLMFICLIVGQLKQKQWKWRPYFYMRLINVSLFLCGMIGISRCGISGDLCKDNLYNK